MTERSQELSATKTPHFATLLLMALAPAEVGRRISQARKAKGWSVRRLADEMGVEQRTVQRWQKGWDEKKGRSLLPRLTGPKGLVHLAEVLEVPSSFFVETDAPEPSLRALATEVGLMRETLEQLIRALEERDPPSDEPAEQQ